MGQERHPGTICSHQMEFFQGPFRHLLEHLRLVMFLRGLHWSMRKDPCSSPPVPKKKLPPSKLLYSERVGWKWKAKGHFFVSTGTN